MREPSANALSAINAPGGESGIWQRQSLNNEIVNADNLQVAPNLRHLYAYLLENGYITSVENFNPDYLSLFPPFVLAKLQSGDASWENDVPTPIVESIKKGKMFGWRERAPILETI
jgi:hypothetical protein